MTKSRIEWTDITDNVLKVEGGGHWCRKISAGCANCYAEAINLNKFFKGNQMPYLGASPVISLDEQMVNKWEKIKKPKKHFVCSMTDLFGEWVPQSMQLKVLTGMWNAKSNGQIFQILTKRPEKAHSAIRTFLLDSKLKSIPKNIWLGVSIESPKYLVRSEELGQIPCNRFWSVEPQLEDLGDIRDRIIKDKISWIIVGGESGSEARRFNPNWAKSIICQCKEVGVPVFIKQMGKNSGFKFSDSKGANWDEWDEELRIREFPEGM